MLVVWIVGILATVFWLWMLIDVLTSGRPADEKILWFLVVFFFDLVGAVACFVIARRRSGSAASGPAANGRGRVARVRDPIRMRGGPGCRPRPRAPSSWGSHTRPTAIWFGTVAPTPDPPMLPSHVYVPARLLAGLGGPVEIRDADDWPHRVTAEYLTLVESRPCVTAALVQELRGRFWVRFADGKETWVSPTPGVWEHRPQPGDRVSVCWSSGI
jgi:hypothetical protein